MCGRGRAGVRQERTAQYGGRMFVFATTQGFQGDMPSAMRQGLCMANCALSAAGPGIGSWFSFQVQCICLTVYHDLQLPRRLEIVLRIRAGPSGRFS